MSLAGLPDLAWPEVGEGSTVLVPVGSTEQHGPHLPLDTDTVIATAVAAALAPALGAVVAPAIPVGASGEHASFPGTVSIGAEALTSVLVELGRSLSAWAGRVVFVNGHGGNLAALTAATGLLCREGRDTTWVPCAVARGDAHAGFTETSVMLHLDPARVRSGLAEPGNTSPVGDLLPALRAHGVRAVSPNGVLGDPTGATAERGAALLDAPVSGGVSGAEAGTLTIMLGGPAALVDRARPLLEELGGALVHVGDRPGDGDAAKTINNMLSATNLAAAAEALAMGIRAGLDPERLVDCVNGGTGASNAMEKKVGGQVLTGRFASRFTLGQYLKDLGIARGLADDHRVPTPVNGAAHAIWTAHAARGHADDDHTRLVALLLADAGIDHDFTANADDTEEAA